MWRAVQGVSGAWRGLGVPWNCGTRPSLPVVLPLARLGPAFGGHDVLVELLADGHTAAGDGHLVKTGASSSFNRATPGFHPPGLQVKSVD